MSETIENIFLTTGNITFKIFCEFDDSVCLVEYILFIIFALIWLILKIV